MLIDDFTDKDLASRLGTRWRAVSDKVMGGNSEPSVIQSVIDNRSCLLLTGVVRLENDGGFIQAVLDLAMPEDTFDASAYAGIRLVAHGNCEQYSVHLRTPNNVRSWQSYRVQFTVMPVWETIDILFAHFMPHRLNAPLDLNRLRRIGLVATGRAFCAELAVSELSFFR